MQLRKTSRNPSLQGETRAICQARKQPASTGLAACIVQAESHVICSVTIAAVTRPHRISAT
jgi:hypothetical protein